MKPAVDRLFSLLRREGAVACGVARAEPVADTDWNYFEEWLALGRHAGMEYMERWREVRRDPRLLLEGACSIVSMAFNYRQPNSVRGVATYALGEDYHKVLRRRLKRVVREFRDEFGGNWRICIDSAPILERYWARTAGVGRRSGLHGNIVVEGVGSMVFLAELVTTLELSPTAPLSPGTIEAEEYGEKAVKAPCPTGALLPGGAIDARKCINYLTIERRGELTCEEHLLTGSDIFGCDRCQLADMANRGAAPEVIPEFRPMAGLREFIEGNNPSFPLHRSPLARGKNLTHGLE